MSFYLWVAIFAGVFLYLGRVARRRRNAGAQEEPVQSPPTRRSRTISAAAMLEEESRWLQPEPDSPRAAAPAAPAPPAKSEVRETVSVVLRRQIPVRFGEEPRSWIGGLPMLPEGVEWPRGTNPELQAKGPRPLHFVAQIACADLPAGLWGGLGPREGWLVFFVNNNSSNTEDPELYRVLHTSELGGERQPPADIGPVHDGMYTGSQFKHYLTQEDVPGTWRRWPVDLVPMPNVLRVVEGRAHSGPENLAEVLYPGCPIADERPGRPAVEPFTWRCAEYGWRKLKATVAAPVAELHRNEQVLREKLVAQGPPAQVVELLDQDVQRLAEAAAKAGEGDDSSTDDWRAWRSRLDQHLADATTARDNAAALLETHASAEALLAFIEEERLRKEAWRTGAVARLAELDAHFASIELDSPLAAEDWQELCDYLKADSCTIWTLGYQRSSDVVLKQQTATLADLFEVTALAASPEVAAEYYGHSQLRALIPDEVIARLEPGWRRLYGERPHRIGGYHDGVQSDAVEGPAEELLLLQLATDDAMQWCWGDAGAVYYYAKPGAIAAGEWSRVTCYLECH